MTAPLARVSFRFSPRGRAAACLARDATGQPYLERWALDGVTPRRRRQELATPVTPSLLPLPLDGGAVLLHRAGDGAHALSLLDGRGERPLGEVAGRALRLLPSTAPGTLAVALSSDGERSTVWRLAAEPPWLEPLCKVDGVLLEGSWLDAAGRRLGADRLSPPGPVKAVAVDLADGSWEPLLQVSARSNDRLLLASARSGLVVVSTDATGAGRLGWATLTGGQVRFPEALARSGSDLAPLAVDEAGERVLLGGDEGARSRLAVYQPEGDRLWPLPLRPGRLRGPVHWSGRRLRFPFSTPEQPTALATLDTGPEGGWSLAGGDGRRWAPARLERFDGAAGPVEAVVYGGERWREAEALVVALHGGPLDAWRYEFDPLFQLLAAAGAAVVAPNQRGSSGYGAGHALAIRGDWGGPDLDDVRRITADLEAERRGPLRLLGVSYGAFLGLLAAAGDPRRWSRCALVAPFTSAPRLARDSASPAVRHLVERLRGQERVRDALALAERVRARLLLAHGEHDPVVPVGHSRALRARLLQRGWVESQDFEYFETAAGHDLLGDCADGKVRERVANFLLEEAAADSEDPTGRVRGRR